MRLLPMPQTLSFADQGSKPGEISKQLNITERRVYRVLERVRAVWNGNALRIDRHLSF
jgi:hypothetical protein